MGVFNTRSLINTTLLLLEYSYHSHNVALKYPVYVNTPLSEDNLGLL